MSDNQFYVLIGVLIFGFWGVLIYSHHIELKLREILDALYKLPRRGDSE